MGDSPDFMYAGASAMLGVAVLTLCLLGHGVRNASGRAILSLTGYLRGRPDPWLDATLRAAFAEFDRELSLVLQDRTARPHHPDH